jgi:hypothetical protein
LFRLQTRIPPSFLDITGRIENELDVRNPNTMVVAAATRRASDFLACVHGSDFDNLWTEGEEFPLAFKCLPNPHTQIIWHTGCPILNHKRMQNPGLYLDAAHQQMPVLRVTFTSLEVQRVAALHSDDIVIVKSPTRNPMGFGLAPPPPSSSLGGGGAGYVGGGGFGGSGFVGSSGLRGHGFVGNMVYGSEPVSSFGGGGGISGVGGGMMFGGGGGLSFTAPTKEEQQFSPQKTLFEKPLMMVDTTILPSTHKTYMDYTKNVDAGLAGEAWRRQTRDCDRNERGNNDLAALEGRRSQNAARVIVLDGNNGGKTNTTGTLTPDVTP